MRLRLVMLNPYYYVIKSEENVQTIILFILKIKLLNSEITDVYWLQLDLDYSYVICVYLFN